MCVSDFQRLTTRTIPSNEIQSSFVEIERSSHLTGYFFLDPQKQMIFVFRDVHNEVYIQTYCIIYKDWCIMQYHALYTVWIDEVWRNPHIINSSHLRSRILSDLYWEHIRMSSNTLSQPAPFLLWLEWRPPTPTLGHQHSLQKHQPRTFLSKSYRCLVLLIHQQLDSSHKIRLTKDCHEPSLTVI